MPFVQMENISHFLRAIQAPPLGLPDHDVFLTVDLYEAKDPAQVLQCLGAFSRRANAIQPSRFKRTLGPKAKGSALSPQSSGTGNGWSTPKSMVRGREVSTTSQSSVSTSVTDDTSVRSSDNPRSPSKGSTQSSPRGGVSSWSRKTDEGTTAPAWNIYQYGYMGGASQGNQGISFGARRQITSASPTVPSIAEKERRRREEEAERERLRVEREEAERREQLEREAEEERERIAEEERWKEETRKRREKEWLEVEEERKRWEEEERRWREEEERRQRATLEAETQLNGAKQRMGFAGINGQYLSQYSSGQANSPKPGVNEGAKRSISESERVRELERQLELARERERQYLAEREESLAWKRGRTVPQRDDIDEMKNNGSPQFTPPRGTPAQLEESLRDHSKAEIERQDVQNEWAMYNTSRQLETPSPNIAPSPDVPRPLPDPTTTHIKNPQTGPSSRPLPDPTTYYNNMNRTDRFLATSPAPTPEKPKTHVANEFGFDSAAERHTEDIRRDESQSKTKAGGWASKSLLEREMERERQRQQEWEEAQKATREAAEKGVGKRLRENTIGEGGSWDVNQYGWMGSDNQNRGGLAFGGRRQIIGPRPPP